MNCALNVTLIVAIGTLVNGEFDRDGFRINSDYTETTGCPEGQVRRPEDGRIDSVCRPIRSPCTYDPCSKQEECRDGFTMLHKYDCFCKPGFARDIDNKCSTDDLTRRRIDKLFIIHNSKNVTTAMKDNILDTTILAIYTAAHKSPDATTIGEMLSQRMYNDIGPNCRVVTYTESNIWFDHNDFHIFFKFQVPKALFDFYDIKKVRPLTVIVKC